MILYELLRHQLILLKLNFCAPVFFEKFFQSTQSITGHNKFNVFRNYRRKPKRKIFS